MEDLKSLEQKKNNFEVIFNRVDPNEPSPIEYFSAQNTLIRLKENTADFPPSKSKEFIESLAPEDILKAMEDIEEKNPGFTINMLYNADYDFIGSYIERAEVADSESEEPVEYFKNKTELIGWLLLYSKSYMHSKVFLDDKIALGNYEIIDRYRDYLKNLKSTNSSYGKVIHFGEEKGDTTQDSFIKGLGEKIDSVFKGEKHRTVIREAGIFESVKRLINQYHAEKVILVDPNFAEDQYVTSVESEIKEIDGSFSKQNMGEDIIYTFNYNNMRREVVLKAMMLGVDTIKELPIAHVYEMGGASVEGTRNVNYLSRLFNQMQDGCVVVDLHRHASDGAYREFAKNNKDIDLIAFSYPISGDSLFSGHSGTEPGYRIMLCPNS